MIGPLSLTLSPRGEGTKSQKLQQAIEHAALVQLTGVYHNLLRQWVET